MFDSSGLFNSYVDFDPEKWSRGMVRSRKQFENNFLKRK